MTSRFQEMSHCIHTDDNFNGNLSLTEVICKLMIGDVGKFEAMNPAASANGTDHNIFDYSIYSDCSPIGDIMLTDPTAYVSQLMDGRVAAYRNS